MSAASSNTKAIAPLPLKIETDLDIQHAEEVHKLLLVQSETPATALDLSAVAACDLTGLQLLFSAQRTASAAGRKFSISAYSPAIVAACTGLGLDVSQLSNSTL
ncbi:MAG TPA: STAS domain-containing protein [Lacunisphaera sp.]|jgi:anti-anti-sigma regulatory factor